MYLSDAGDYMEDDDGYVIFDYRPIAKRKKCDDDENLRRGKKQPKKKYKQKGNV